jgi:hypothetical protein
MIQGHDPSQSYEIGVRSLSHSYTSDLHMFRFWIKFAYASLSMCKNHPAPMFCDLPVFRFRIEFALCFFTMGFKPMGVGHSQNVRLDLAIVLSPLFWECPHIGTFPHT